MSSKVLITGGSGLLAVNWAATIRDQCSVVLGLHERNIVLADTQASQLDLESTDHLQRQFEAIRPDLVIHAAGFTDVDRCEADPDLAEHVNVRLAENVARASAKLGLPLVHISTDHLFSGEKPLVDEAAEVAPRNVYGRTKAEGERRVLDAHTKALVIRTNFFGWGPAYRRSFTDLIIEALRSGRTVTLFEDVFYTPILIEALVGATHALVDRQASGIFHVVGDERISKHDFGLRIAAEFGLEPGLIASGFLEHQRDLVQRPLDMSLSNTKVSKLIGGNLGGVDQHIARLHQQEREGLAEEIQQL